MEGARLSVPGDPSDTGSDAPRLIAVAQARADDPNAAEGLIRGLGAGPFALVCLFVSPDADIDAVAGRVAAACPEARAMACTTAGEIGADGYEDGQIIALGFPAALFHAATYVIPDLGLADEQAVTDRFIQERSQLAQIAADHEHEFAMLLCDGLSRHEEHLTAMLSAGLGTMPLFGGSAGDGTRFAATWLWHDGACLQDAAIVALIRSRCRAEVFSHDHMRPSETRMVVTGADPTSRTVWEINAEPAAREYARLLGKDAGQLSTFTFAAHPVVVRLGDSHHVRAIQRVDSSGHLVFFSAINEGMVLTLADRDDIAARLETCLAALNEVAPAQVLACDCLLRRIEAQQGQQSRAVSDILRRYRVSGFSTYGEQIGGLHVNQTLTGVALYPPEA